MNIDEMTDRQLIDAFEAFTLEMLDGDDEAQRERGEIADALLAREGVDFDEKTGVFSL